MFVQLMEAPSKTMRRARFLALASVLAVGAAAARPALQDPSPQPAAVAAPEVDEVYFGPKFQPDRIVKYLFRADNMSVQEAAGQQMIDRSDTEYVMRFTVNKVHEDGSADLTMTYDRFYTEGQSLFGAKYLFDSTQETPDPETDPKVTEAWRKLVSSTITFKADAQGNVDPESVKGAEEAAAMMDELTPVQGRAGEYKPQGLAELFASTWRVANETYTRDINQPWTDVQKTPVPGMGTWTFTSDYQKIQRTEDRVVLGMKMMMELEFQPPDEPSDDMLKVLETKFDMIKGNWQYIWDPKQNELIERVGEIEFNWLLVQEPIFEGDKPVRTNQHQRVQTMVRRLEE